MKRLLRWAAATAGLVAAAWPAHAAAAAAAGTPMAVYEVVAPAVVLVVGTEDGERIATGTGSLVTADGLVLTNAHVVSRPDGRPWTHLFAFLRPPELTGDGARDLRLRHPARVVAADARLDLALLRMDGVADAPTVRFADPDRVPIGAPVVAIGHPGGGGYWTLTAGSVGALRDTLEDLPGAELIQTDAGLNPGNSGGPLLDLDALLVGVNTAIYRKSDSGLAITGINFAIRSSVAVRWLNQVQGDMRFGYAVADETPAVPGAAAPAPAPTPAPDTAPPPGAVDRPATPSWRQVTPSRPVDPDALRRQMRDAVRERAHDAMRRLDEATPKR